MVLEVLVDEKGRPRPLCVLVPLDRDLDREAPDAASRVGQWGWGSD